ncbi:MAG: ROK family protein, partial [Spirochaetales bacterium]
GILLFTPNLGFKDFPIKEKIEKEFGVPMLLENDVNAGTYGEFMAGAARGFRHVVGVFPGTGIGGGLIINGRLFVGGSGNAGEIGHMIIQVEGPLCGCGHYGCLEALASRTAMAKDAVSIAGSGKPTSAYAKAGTDVKKYKSSVFKLGLKEEDPYLTEIIDRSAYFLGIGIANCIHILNPEVVVIGGGLVEKLGDYYMNEVEKSMRKHTLPQLLSEVKLLKAVLGDDAAVIGAAGIYQELTGSR